MSIPILTHDEAIEVGKVLRGPYPDARLVLPKYENELGWGDLIQFVLLTARNVEAAREALAERAVRDSEVSRAPVTRTIGDLKSEIGK